MIKYTKSTLNKLTGILEEAGYITRFEKGTFQPGSAIVKDKKIVVINKFFDTEARINTILDLMQYLDIQPEILSKKSAAFYRQLVKDGLILTKNQNEEE